MILSCTNCGWDNKDGSLRCEKCDTRLSLRVDPISNNSINENSNGLHGTIKGQQFEKVNDTQKASPFSSGSSKGDEPEDVNVTAGPPSEKTKKCPNISCGFINRYERLTCIVCQTELILSSPAAQPAGEENNPEQKASTNSSPGFAQTIDPYREKKARKSSCTLLLIQTVSENKTGQEPNFGRSPEGRVFECLDGESVVLNRGNIEPGNNTITSKEQADLQCEGDKWYLIDRSSKKTTFILASQKTELHDGDIILMGDRKITFKING